MAENSLIEESGFTCSITPRIIYANECHPSPPLMEMIDDDNEEELYTGESDDGDSQSPANEVAVASDEFEWIQSRPAFSSMKEENNEKDITNERKQLPLINANAKKLFSKDTENYVNSTISDQCDIEHNEDNKHQNNITAQFSDSHSSKVSEPNYLNTSDCLDEVEDHSPSFGNCLATHHGGSCLSAFVPRSPFSCRHCNCHVTSRNIQMELTSYGEKTYEDMHHSYGGFGCHCCYWFPSHPHNMVHYFQHQDFEFTRSCSPNSTASVSPSASPFDSLRRQSKSLRRNHHCDAELRERSFHHLNLPHTEPEQSTRRNLKVGGYGHDYEDLQDKIHRLESEKENLLLQVNILSEQVDAQNDKIQELEKVTEDRKEQLDSTEEMLRLELMSRSSVENSKLDLMSELSTFRLRLATAEEDKRDVEEKCKKFESDLILVQARLVEKEAEIATLKSRSVRNGTVTPIPEYGLEIEKLKRALESVMAANDEKEKKIEELRSTLNRYKRVQDLVFSGQGNKDFPSPRIGQSRERILLDESLLPSSQSNGNAKRTQPELRLTDKPPPVPRLLLHSTASSPPLNSDCIISSPSSWREGNLSCTSSPSPVYNNSSPSSFSPSFYKSPPIQRASSAENVSPPQQKTPPIKRNYVTMPRHHGTQLQQIHNQLENSSLNYESCPSHSMKSSPSPSTQNIHQGLDNHHHIRNKGSGISFGKGFFKLRKAKHSSSAPELAQSELGHSSPEQDSLRCASSLSHGSPLLGQKLEKEKDKGIKKIFGKLKRTGSQNLDSQEGELKRGGIRATAGPRLGWSSDARSHRKTNLPFPCWDAETLSEWLHKIGLSMYVGECKRWIKSGDQLLKATSQELEKELGIKNPLHRKKLQLAIQAISSNKNASLEKSSKLDHLWVIRWLDDIGLPQYKDNFCENRVDGNVLHFLTVEDLFSLKVTNQLHHTSIKRSIQVLRANGFDPYALKRRSLPDESKDYSPENVALWTNHRVMEWLKTVDLSEYAPNLRGSGVHGALMVYEPRFNADLLATLLNIPPSKTLLRRHLSTQFKQLIGMDLMYKKRECESHPGHIPLTPNMKVKAVRRGQFSLMRKRGKNDIAFEDYICPLNSLNNEVSQSLDVDSEKQSTASTTNSESSSEETKEALLNEDKIFNAMTSTNV